MKQDITLTRQRLKTPRAAAIAGIIFSILLIISLALIRVAVPTAPVGNREWLERSWRMVELALNLVPFSGIAFLWFIGVVRDRLGEYEDRFFSTVFLGSGLLFLGLLFSSAAVAGGTLSLFDAASSAGLIESGIYSFGRAITYETLNVYAMKMAGVFMISTCTLGLRTGIFSRWLVYGGYVLALIQILSIGFMPLAALLFPIWVLLVSMYILWANYDRPEEIAASPDG